MRILEPEREPDPELRDVLDRLSRWGGQTHYPLALHLLDRVDGGQATPHQAARALAYAESYMVRRLFTGHSTTGSNRVFMEMPKDLEKDDDPAEAVRRFLSKNKTGARVWPDDDAVREAIRNRPFYKTGRSNQRFQVLRRLEESYGASEPVDYAKALAGPVDRFLARLRPMRFYMRENWGFASRPDRHLPDPIPPVDPARDNDFFLRIEAQGFLKLPATSAVVFSIRTTITHWSDVPEDCRAAFVAAAKSLSPAWLAYKSIVPG